MRSETLIDMLIHNNDLVLNTTVIQSSSFDHSFVLANHKLEKTSLTPKPNEIYSKNLSEENINQTYGKNSYISSV
jgi:hypothetical protein